MFKPQVIMIVAALMPDLGIGFQGKLPWRLKNELINFRKITTNSTSDKQNAVVMGRKTWESIPPKFRPLPNRKNIVISRSSAKDHGIDDDRVDHINDLQQLQELKNNESLDKIFIIGGSEIYNQLFNSSLVDKIILTELKSQTPIEIDTWLKWDLNNGQWIKNLNHDLSTLIGFDMPESFQENGFDYHYTLLLRLTSS